MRSKAQPGGTERNAANAGAGPRGASLALHDLTQRTDLALQQARNQRILLMGVFATILGVGIVALLANPSNWFPLIAIALIVLGGINGAISAGGLWRVIGEQRMRERERLAAASRPASGQAFDQTNGAVDLGHATEQADPSDGLNQARRLSSMNAAGIAYANGTR